MNKELLERLAKESSIHIGPEPNKSCLGTYLQPWVFEKIASRVAEECAKECDSMAEKSGTNRLQQLALDLAADAIRAKFPAP